MAWLEVHHGSSRTTILMGRCAFKIPSLYDWEHFLLGLLANGHENKFQSTAPKYLCPILFRLPGGFLNVYPRCDITRGDAKTAIEFFTRLYELEESGDGEEIVLQIVEYKPDSVGTFEGKIYAIDYGSGGCYEINKETHAINLTVSSLK